MIQQKEDFKTQELFDENQIKLMEKLLSQENLNYDLLNKDLIFDNTEAMKQLNMLNL